MYSRRESRFQKGDHVRVTNPQAAGFGNEGFVKEIVTDTPGLHYPIIEYTKIVSNPTMDLYEYDASGDGVIVIDGNSIPGQIPALVYSETLQTFDLEGKTGCPWDFFDDDELELIWRPPII